MKGRQYYGLELLRGIPFFAAGLCAVLGKLLPHPFGAGVVLFDWVLCYLLAVVGTMAMQRTFLKRFV